MVQLLFVRNHVQSLSVGKYYSFVTRILDAEIEQECIPVGCGNITISLLMNINLGHLGGASILRMFTTTRPHGSVNTTTWLAISQFF